MTTTVFRATPDGQIRHEWRLSFDGDMVRVRGLWWHRRRADGSGWSIIPVEGAPVIPADVINEAVARFRMADFAFDRDHFERLRTGMDPYRHFPVVRIDYTNHRGTRSDRVVLPVELRHEATEHHPERQWLLDAWDLGKRALRTFAMQDVHSWSPASEADLEAVLGEREVPIHSKEGDEP